MMTLKELVNSINSADDAITDLQASKSETYTAYREQLISQGVNKANAKVQMEAIKAAIRRIRALENDEGSVLEKDDLIDSIVSEIRSGTRNATRTHAHESHAAA